MKWFRLWHEWGHDPKVISMPEHMQCRHIKLLCLRRQVDTSTLSDEEIAAYMRIDMEALNETKQLFEKKGFIDNGWSVLAWDFRNPQSDDGATRARKYRERQKKKKSDVTVTSPSRYSNVPDTEGDKDKDIYTPKFETLWGLYPRKIDKRLAYKKYKATLNKGADYKDLQKATTNYGKAMAGKEKEHIKHGATWFGPNEPWKEWIDGPPEGFAGATERPRVEDPHKHLRCKRCKSYQNVPDWLNAEGYCERCEQTLSRNAGPNEQD